VTAVASTDAVMRTLLERPQIRISGDPTNQTLRDRRGRRCVPCGTRDTCRNFSANTRTAATERVCQA
jgi:hypothetical protein